MKKLFKKSILMLMASLIVFSVSFMGCESDDDGDSPSTVSNATLYLKYGMAMQNIMTKAETAGSWADQVDGDKGGYFQAATGGPQISFYFEDYTDDGEFIINGTLETVGLDMSVLGGLGDTASAPLRGTLTVTDGTISSEGDILTLTLTVEATGIIMDIEGEISAQSKDVASAENFPFAANDIQV